MNPEGDTMVSSRFPDIIEFGEDTEFTSGETKKGGYLSLKTCIS